MYISKRYRFVYIGIPKTASTSLHRFFRDVMGPNDLQGGDLWQHRTGVPAWAGEFRVVATVRDPAERMRSLWRHSQTSGRKREEIPEMPFTSFVERVVRNIGLTPFYTKRQCDYLDADDRRITFWLTSAIGEKLSGNPVPRINTTFRRTGFIPDTDIDNAVADARIRSYCLPDWEIVDKAVPPSLRGIFP